MKDSSAPASFLPPSSVCRILPVSPSDLFPLKGPSPTAQPDCSSDEKTDFRENIAGMSLRQLSLAAILRTQDNGPDDPSSLRRRGKHRCQRSRTATRLPLPSPGPHLRCAGWSRPNPHRPARLWRLQNTPTSGLRWCRWSSLRPAGPSIFSVQNRSAIPHRPTRLRGA